MTPGSNLLAEALTLIAPQAVTYRAYTAQTTNEAGEKTATYANPVTRYGSFQPVSRTVMALQGLDMDKRYALFYVSSNIRNPGRDGSGDLFGFNGRAWQAMGGADWFAIDGWDATLLVDVGPDE